MQKIVLMGVSGSGKSVVGAALAGALGGVFIDGDDLHPAGNVAKMSAGTPLDDDDRAPWLDRVGGALHSTPGTVVIACSALKRVYRDRIRDGALSPVLFVHLVGDRGLIGRRMAGRSGHFMPTALLDSQFKALEPPGADETAISLSVEPSPGQIVSDILRHLRGAPVGARGGA